MLRRHIDQKMNEMTNTVIRELNQVKVTLPENQVASQKKQVQAKTAVHFRVRCDGCNVVPI